MPQESEVRFMAKEVEHKKMTLEEYKSKYTKPYNMKATRLFLVVFAGTIGIIIFTCLLMVVLRIYDMNEIAGYIAIAPAVLLFVFLYIVPLVKITRLSSFVVNVDGTITRRFVGKSRIASSTSRAKPTTSAGMTISGLVRLLLPSKPTMTRS